MLCDSIKLHKLCHKQLKTNKKTAGLKGLTQDLVTRCQAYKKYVKGLYKGMDCLESMTRISLPMTVNKHDIEINAIGREDNR